MEISGEPGAEDIRVFSDPPLHSLLLVEEAELLLLLSEDMVVARRPQQVPALVAAVEAVEAHQAQGEMEELQV